MTLLAFDIQCPTVFFNEILDKEQAKTCTWLPISAQTIGLFIKMEKVVNDLPTHADTIITDGNLYHAIRKWQSHNPY